MASPFLFFRRYGPPFSVDISCFPLRMEKTIQVIWSGPFACYRNTIHVQTPEKKHRQPSLIHNIAIAINDHLTFLLLKKIKDVIKYIIVMGK